MNRRERFEAEMQDIVERSKHRRALAQKPKRFLCRIGLHRMQEDTSDLLRAWGGYGESCRYCGHYQDTSNR